MRAAPNATCSSTCSQLSPVERGRRSSRRRLGDRTPQAQRASSRREASKRALGVVVRRRSSRHPSSNWATPRSPPRSGWGGRAIRARLAAAPPRGLSGKSRHPHQAGAGNSSPDGWVEPPVGRCDRRRARQSPPVGCIAVGSLGVLGRGTRPRPAAATGSSPIPPPTREVVVEKAPRGSPSRRTSTRTTRRRTAPRARVARPRPRRARRRTANELRSRAKRSRQPPGPRGGHAPEKVGLVRELSIALLEEVLAGTGWQVTRSSDVVRSWVPSLAPAGGLSRSFPRSRRSVIRASAGRSSDSACGEAHLRLQAYRPWIPADDQGSG